MRNETPFEWLLRTDALAKYPNLRFARELADARSIKHGILKEFRALEDSTDWAKLDETQTRFYYACIAVLNYELLVKHYAEKPQNQTPNSIPYVF